MEPEQQNITEIIIFCIGHQKEIRTPFVLSCFRIRFEVSKTATEPKKRDIDSVKSKSERETLRSRIIRGMCFHSHANRKRLFYIEMISAKEYYRGQRDPSLRDGD